VGMSPQGGVLDAKLGTAVLRSVDTLMKYNLLEFAEEGSTASTSGSTASEGNKPKQKANLPILLGVFGFLLLILVVLVITQIH
jgi:hypothetical protein